MSYLGSLGSTWAFWCNLLQAENILEAKTPNEEGNVFMTTHILVSNRNKCFVALVTRAAKGRATHLPHEERGESHSSSRSPAPGAVMAELITNLKENSSSIRNSIRRSRKLLELIASE